MDPIEKTELPKEKPQVSVAPPVEPPRSRRTLKWLARTGGSFTAEYSLFLIMLGVSLSNLVWLVYMFFGLVVDAIMGAGVASFIPAHLFALWLFISSLISLPLAYVLWRRVHGGLTADYNGELPKGAARGFRTVWLIMSVLSITGLLMAALYAPLAAALSGGLGTVLLSVTLPSLINVAITGAGVYLVTYGMRNVRRSHLLLAIVALVLVTLFAVNYVWASNTRHSTPSYTRPAETYDPYQGVYDDTYYNYTPPSDYR